MKKKLKQASALVQAVAFSIMCQNGAVTAYAENSNVGIDNKKNLEPSYIYMLETPSPTGEVAVKFVDEFGNEVDFDLIPDIDMADNYGSYYNLYDENRATSIKDQGQEGLCWAHAGMSSVESNLITQNLEPSSVDLSEKHMAWFTNGAGPSNTSDPLYGDISNAYGTAAYDEGGNIYGFTATLARGSGPVYESVVPYSTKTALSEDLRYQSLYQVEDMTLFDPSDRTAIKKALVNNGVVYLNYCSSNMYLNNSSNGYCYYCPTAYQTNHAVSIVGWDDNFSKDNFGTTPEGDGAWIIKNSWGTDWGDDGFFYLSYYDATVETVGSFSMGEVEDSINVYQYDGNYRLGTRYGGCGISMANIFTSDSDEQLEAISFWTRDAEVPYTIRVYMDVPEGEYPTSGNLVYTHNGTMNYAGYHKVTINTPVELKKGCRYSIVVDLLKDSTSVVLDSCSSGTGVSFYSAYYEGFSDPYDWKDAGTNKNSNVCLKAFTSESEGLTINSAAFPDATFRQYVSNKFDTDKNGYFSQAELDAVTNIDISGKEASPNTVANLKGIEYFTKLIDLDCSYNQLTTLDVSKNTALKNLSCSGNQLTTLDVSKNTALITLSCSANHLTSLDLSNNNALGLLICDDNRYSVGDIVGGCSLSDLPTGFDPNKASDWTNAEYDPATNYIRDFTSTEVSYRYNCGGGFSMVFTLTASSYKPDYVVKVDEEAFPDATFRQYVSDKFDTDSNGRLTQTEIDKATSINISGTSSTPNTVADLSGIEYFTKLTSLYCSYNQLTTLDVSHNTSLKNLYCYNNQLTSLNLSNAADLTYLYCYRNKLASLNLSDNTALKSLDVNNNQLTSLDLSENINLTSLYCYSNQLTSINVSNLTNLSNLSCYNNQLASLDLSDNINLSGLSCYNNQLTSLNVSSNTALNSINVKDNKLTRLDVSNNTALTILTCSNNHLTSLDLSNNTSLNNLYCSGNSYSIGDVIGSYSLKDLPTGFDPAKASNWKYATYNSDTKSLTNFTSTTVTYTYYCGNSKSATFTLKADSYIPIVSKPQNVKAVEGTNSVTLSWNAAEGADKYTIYTVDNGEFTKKADTTALTYTLNDLIGGTKYGFVVQAWIGEYYSELAVSDAVYATPNKPVHTHSPATTYSKDATGHWYTCSGCSEKVNFEYHTEDSGTVTKDPTETTEGERTYKCTECGYVTRTEAIEVLEHTHSLASTYSTNESGHWHACSGCSEKVDFESHTEDSGTVTKDPTETTEGVKTYKCKKCGYVIRTESIAVLEHTHSLASTYSTNESGHWHACSGCSEKVGFESHTEDSGTVTKDPTETTEGVKTYKCTKCGYVTRTEAIEVLEHTHSPATTYSNDATGHWHACSGCSEKVNFEYHTEDSGTVTKDPTETTEGVKTYKCTKCGYVTRTEAIAVLEPSEPITSFVERLYQNILNRPSDPSKVSHIDNLNNGKSACKVAYDFVFSSEFANQPISNEERVRIMYRTFLNREADPAGLADWTAVLDNGCSIGHIFYGFTQSNEFTGICDEYGINRGTWECTENRDRSSKLTAFVSRLYTKAMGRSYDVNGLNDHTGSYLENRDLYQLAYNFIFSSEFIGKNLSDEEFVDVMYRTFFDREADPAGKADWLGRMANGATREDVLAGFVGSQECADLVARFGI